MKQCSSLRGVLSMHALVSLQSRVLEQGDDSAAAGALRRVIGGFCVQLLEPGSDAGLPFVGRLLHLIRVRSPDPGPTKPSRQPVSPESCHVWLQRTDVTYGHVPSVRGSADECQFLQLLGIAACQLHAIRQSPARKVRMVRWFDIAEVRPIKMHMPASNGSIQGTQSRSINIPLQENPIEPPAGSRLPTVVDSLGNAVSRATLLLRERTLLTECLLYAVALRQRLAAADVAALVDVVHGLALRTRGTGAGVPRSEITSGLRVMVRVTIRVRMRPLARA